MRGPCEIRFQEAGPAFQFVKFPDADQVAQVLPCVRREFVVGNAELMPVDSSELERGVVALEGEGGGVWVVCPGFLEGGGV